MSLRVFPQRFPETTGKSMVIDINVRVNNAKMLDNIVKKIAEDLM